MSIDRVVLVAKTSALQRQRRRPDPKLTAVLDAGGLHASRIVGAHDEHMATLEYVTAALRSQGVRLRTVDALRRRDARWANLIVTVGGDGTFLRASHCVESGDEDDGTPMLGVNSATGSSVGFFCAANRTNFESVLSNLQAGALRSSGLWRLQVAINGESVRDLALNDVLVAHRVPAETTRYTLRTGGQTQRQKSSGVWVATAAGSTGAIRSSGGTIYPLGERRLQYRVRELFPLSVRGASPLVRGLVSDVLEMESHIPSGVLYIDGSHKRVFFGTGDVITFTPSKRPLPWIAATDVEVRRDDVRQISEQILLAAGMRSPDTEVD
ncbi:MAG: NAD(+)/NADH kinase [Myxococcales bacterium]|nr:NAD(+)/NADH kinase [Myxococcales bacterium]